MIRGRYGGEIYEEDDRVRVHRHNEMWAERYDVPMDVDLVIKSRCSDGCYTFKNAGHRALPERLYLVFDIRAKGPW